MNLTNAQRTALKTHLAANTNQVQAKAQGTGDATSPTAINAVDLSIDFNAQAVADWYNTGITGSEAQPFTAPTALWNPSLGMQDINAGVSFGTLIPHDLGGSPTVDQQYLSRIYKLLFFQTLTWNSKIDMTDAQQRAGIFNTFGNSPNASTDGIAAVGKGRKLATRIEHLFAGAATGQAGIGGAIGRNSGTDKAGQLLYGQLVDPATIVDAKNNG